MKKIVFRVDSGSHIGMGHVMRCLTLANEFKNLGCEIFFITKDHNGFSSDVIPSFYTAFVLSGGLINELSLNLKNDYASWLGEPWEDDLKKTNHILQTIGEVDLVVLDHYALDERYERQLFCKKILVIDDLMNRKHFCDFLLDQNTSAELEAYQNLTNEKRTQLLLGPNYALLKREFSSLRSFNAKERSKKIEIKKILVFFGGGDVGNDCLKFANSLSEQELSRYKFTFILNTFHPTFNKLSSWVNSHQNSVTLFSFVEKMADLITEHDFFIGAGGSTSWERVCLGIPSAIVSVADNQIKISESLGRLKLTCYLGESCEVDALSWRKFLDETLIDYEYFREMSIRCFKVTGGDGAFKVASTIIEGLE